MNAGYKGKTHGEMKLKKPAPNARNMFTSVAKELPPLVIFFFLSIVSERDVEYVLFVCEQFMTHEKTAHAPCHVRFSALFKRIDHFAIDTFYSKALSYLEVPDEFHAQQSLPYAALKLVPRLGSY